MRQAVAAIMPLRRPDYGVDWATDREHAVIEVPTLDEAERVAASLRADGADAAAVDLDRGITPAWPSAGDPTSIDPFHIAAARLSVLQWQRLSGISFAPHICDDEIGFAAFVSGAIAARDAAALLPPGDPVRVALEAAAESVYRL